MRKDISIIIVNWNTKEYLLNCLVSIKKYLHDVTYETIVVDNGSKDGSQEIIPSQFSWVRFFETGENLGFARANNIGMKHSTGRFICLVNSDVEFIDDCTTPMIQYMDDHPDVGILGPKLLNSDMTIQHSFFSFPSIINTIGRTFAFDHFIRRIKPIFGLKPKINYDTPTRVDALSGAFLIIRREAFEAIGGFDENLFMYSEDIDLAKRYRLGGWDVKYFPLVKAIHYGGGSSATNPVRFFIEQQRAKLYFLNKHENIFKRFVIYILMILNSIVRLPYWIVHYCVFPSEHKKSSTMVKRYYNAVKWLLTVRQ